MQYVPASMTTAQSICVKDAPYNAKGDGLTDDTAALQAALNAAGLVNGCVYLPGTSARYLITSPLTVPAGVSLRGDGLSSVIYANGCDGLTFAYDAVSYEATGTARFVRDLQLFGSNATTSANNGIVVNYTVASGHRVTGITFDNVVVKDFGTAAYLRQAWNFNWVNCDFINSYQGFYFYGQNIKHSIVNCFLQNYTMTGSGGSNGLITQSVAGESTQSVQVFGSQFYNFTNGINIVLGFEIQIEHCDISNCLATGVSITTTQGGVWVRDCWIQIAAGLSAITYGVQINAVAVQNQQDIHISSNHILNGSPYAGSIGVSMASAQVGVSVTDNAIYGFDIGVYNLAVTGAVIKHNRINILTSVYSAASKAVSLNSSSTDNEVGPNLIQTGDATVNTGFYQAATMSASSANITVTNSAAFPVGTGVMFSAGANGFIGNVVYTVLSSAANVITVGPLGGSAITATGSTAVNVLAVPDPVYFNAGTPTGLALFARGNFAAQLTGVSAGGAGYLSYAASGKLVQLIGLGMPVGTSNATTLSVTGVPVFLRPSATRYIGAILQDNGSNFFGYVQMLTGAAPAFFKDFNGTAFTASGNKGINGDFMPYAF